MIPHIEKENAFIICILSIVFLFLIPISFRFFTLFPVRLKGVLGRVVRTVRS